MRGIGAARDWIAGEMRRYAEASGGRMTVTVPSYVQPVASRIPAPTVISNVVATLRGDADPDRVYIVSGHYDSRASNVDDATSDAPGADDDASGVAVAMELALTGDNLPAQRAHELGLVNVLTEPGKALEGAIALAEKITANGPLAVAATKKIIVQAREWNAEEMWRKQMEIFLPVFASNDAKEGAIAFAEKRPPRWTGS